MYCAKNYFVRVSGIVQGVLRSSASVTLCTVEGRRVSHGVLHLFFFARAKNKLREKLFSSGWRECSRCFSASVPLNYLRRKKTGESDTFFFLLARKNIARNTLLFCFIFARKNCAKKNVLPRSSFSSRLRVLSLFGVHTSLLDGLDTCKNICIYRPF